MPSRAHRRHHAARTLNVFTAAALTAAVLLGTGCGGEGGTTPPPTPEPPAAVATVELAPAGTVELTVGEFRALVITTRDGQGRELVGRMVQLSSSAPAIASVVSGNPGGVTGVTAVTPGGAIITATSEGRSASVAVNVLAPAPADVSILNAQWTQGTQAPDGSIPMVLGGNAAVLNVLLSSTSRAISPGPLVLTLRDESDAVVRADTVSVAPFVGEASWRVPSAQFLVPASELRSGLRWRLQRDPAGTASDVEPANDVFPRDSSSSLATVSLPTIRLRFVPIALAAHGSVTGNVDAVNLEEYLPKFRRIFPMGELEATVAVPFATGVSFGAPPTGGDAGFWVPLLQELDLARVADAGSGEDYWLGVVPPPAGFTFTAFGGFAYIPGNTASSGPATRTGAVVHTGWFTNTGQTADLVVHETAHMLGRRHAPCGGASGTDPAFPEAGGLIGSVGHDVFAWASGLAPRAASVSASTGDLMGYCFPQWTSPYTYSGMLRARERTITALAGAIAANMGRRQPVLVVRGREEDGRLTLLPAVTIDGFPTPEVTAGVMVELRDARGGVIARRRGSLQATDHGRIRTFTVAFPFEERAASQLSTVTVRDELGRKARLERRAVGVRPDMEVLLSAASLLRPGGLRVRCGSTEASALVVQEVASGRVLGATQGAELILPTVQATQVTVTCTDGVHSERRSVGADALRAAPLFRR